MYNDVRAPECVCRSVDPGADLGWVRDVDDMADDGAAVAGQPTYRRVERRLGSPADAGSAAFPSGLLGNGKADRCRFRRLSPERACH